MVLGDTFAVSGRMSIDDLSAKSIAANSGPGLWICAIKNGCWECECADEFSPSSDNKETLSIRGSLWLSAYRSLSYLSYDVCDMDLC